MADHGAVSRYQHGKCRCLACRRAMREYQQSRAQGLPAGDPRHGTTNGYRNLGCRCEDCTAANREAHYEYMHADPQRLARHALSMRRSRSNGGDR